jgi:hypothetical protein
LNSGENSLLAFGIEHLHALAGDSAIGAAMVLTFGVLISLALRGSLI